MNEIISILAICSMYIGMMFAAKDIAESIRGVAITLNEILIEMKRQRG